MRLLPAIAGAMALATGVAAAQAPATGATAIDSVTLAGMPWRQVGPANMGGRVTDVEGIPSPSRTFYVAAAAGGIWKTRNAGTTFQPVFYDQRVASMGDIAIAPSDTNTVYAGSGEEDSRNSISPGGGVFKTTDGGKTWQSIGLEKTEQIGRIVVHPTDPNTAYVAAVGAVWRSNPERGLYKTTDGGKSWKQIKFVSDRAGFVDVVMDPRDPNVLYASSWERVRGPYFLKSGGPGSALWKTTDAGATWTEIEGGGFPETMKGRIGLALAPSNPDIVYALVEADSAKGEKELKNGLYRSDDAGRNWRMISDNNVRPFYYSQVRVHPTDPDHVWWSSTPVSFSRDAGKTVGNATVGIHVDHHAMWIDPNDPAHIVVGDDGGVSQSWDGGGSWDFMNQMALGQFYEVSYDMAVPYRVCGGLQDNGSWCGPSRRRGGELGNAFWFTFSGGDGFYTAQDPDDPNILYGESQGGRMSRVNYATGERTPLGTPSWRRRYQQLEDSVLIARGDTTTPETGATKRRVAAFRAMQKADSSALDMRFNWNTPFFLSPHNPSVFYAAGNRVLKSIHRGDDLYPISPDLSKQDAAKIRISTTTTGGITNDATGAETYGTVTTLAESYVRPGLLYAGTDDGNVWLTRNDGAEWENLTGRFPGLPADAYVVRIEPSHADSATFYVAFDNHRVGDFAPYLYVSTDYGRTFRPIVDGLPTGGADFLHVVREDPTNPDLLYVGTDVGVHVSLDRGAHWQRFMTGLPTVPVHDLKIHPRDHELIAATHGRSIWIADVLPLQQLADSIRARPAHLFAPKIAFQYGSPPALGEDPGHKVYAVNPPPYGAELTYRVAPGAGRTAAAAAGGAADEGGAQPSDSARAARRARMAAGGNGAPAGGRGATGGRGGAPGAGAQLVITDVGGDTLETLAAPMTPGIHRVYWSFRGKPAPAPELSPSQKRDSIQTARKTQALFDSLATTGLPRAMLDKVQRDMLGGGGFRFGGGGGSPDYGEMEFKERPGETTPRAERRAGTPAPARAPGAEITEAEVRTEVLAAMRASGIGRGGFRSGGGAGMVETGDYLVTLVVDGKPVGRQVLRVERVAGFNGEAINTQFEDENDREP
ncbi:MAG: WD40/YVTN/BNR-like repeat-containing protein [Gemmatimonadaceae bacterium]